MPPTSTPQGPRRADRRACGRATSGVALALLAAVSLSGCSALDDGVGFVSEEVAVSSAAAELATALESSPATQSVESAYELSDLTLDVTLVLDPAAAPADAAVAVETALEGVQQEVFADRLPTVLVAWDGAALVAESAREAAAWNRAEIEGWVTLASTSPVLVELEVAEAGLTGRAISWPADHPVAGARAELFADARTIVTVADLRELVTASAETGWAAIDEAWTIPGLSAFGRLDDRVSDIVGALPADAPVAWPTAESIRGVGIVVAPTVTSVGWYGTGAELAASDDWPVVVEVFRAAVDVLPAGSDLTYASAQLQAVATLGGCADGVADSAVADDDAAFVRALEAEGITGLTAGRCAQG